MLCLKCGFEQPDDLAECMKCGIIFEKYIQRKHALSEMSEGQQPSSPTTIKEDDTEETKSTAKELFFYIKPDINIFYFVGRALIFLAILIWGWKFIITPIESNYAGRSFLHLINLPFHEAGHMIFRPFGQFMMMLGGSLTQLLVPFICFLTFLLKTRDTFASSVALWWLGESMMDLAPYINDARELKLILLGGVTGRDVADYHDWEFILRKLGLLQYDHFLAGFANTVGILLMVITFVWGGILLYRQFQNLDLS